MSTIKSFSESLLEWYHTEKRDLPWRQTQEPYKVWLSEIILQQTRVVQGLPYYERMLKEFPKVEDLANAPEDKVLKLWQGLGYYSRARNLHATAKKVAYEMEGVFPTDYQGLLGLKGVGNYTASAIASICYNEAVAVVDGNVYRVLARYFGIDTPINSTEGIKQFKVLANKVLDTKKPGTYNQAIMDFGALQCKPQSPDCPICPLQISCEAYQTGKVSELPVKIKKTKIKKVYIDYWVITDKNQRTILEKREGKGIWEGLYEFPNTESEIKRKPQQIQEDIGQKYGAISRFSLLNEKPITHKLSHRNLQVRFWRVQLENTLENTISKADIHQFPVSALTAKFLEKFDF